MRRQVGRVLTAVVVVGAVVSGCGGPNQAGSAVIIGDDAVSITDVQSALDVKLAEPGVLDSLRAQGGGPADIASDIVTSEITHSLLAREASAAGFGVSNEAVEATITQQGGEATLLESTLLSPSELRDRVRDVLIAAELGKRAVGGLLVTFDLVAATSDADAEQKAKTLQAGGAGAAALLSAGPQTALPNQTVSAITSPDEASGPLFGTPAGGVGWFQPSQQQSQWLVYKINDRRTDAPSDAAAAATLSQDQLTAIGKRTLQPVADQLGIRVNPRYGVWDPINLRVLSKDRIAGKVLPAAASAG